MTHPQPQTTPSDACASRDVQVHNTNGFHFRPAVQLAEVANAFESEIHITRQGGSGVTVDGKSVMALVTLEATYGTRLTIAAAGADAEAAVEAVAKLFEEKFGEN